MGNKAYKYGFPLRGTGKYGLVLEDSCFAADVPDRDAAILRQHHDRMTARVQDLIDRTVKPFKMKMRSIMTFPDTKVCIK